MPLSPTLIWLIAGAGLCLAEVVFPTAFVAFMLGISALIVAAVSSLIPFNLQVALWMLLSLVLVTASRRLVRQRAAFKLDATEAEALTEIPAGKTGRVLYEGNSWLARCEDQHQAIALQEKVYVVSRQGTMLIVVPEATLRQM